MDHTVILLRTPSVTLSSSDRCPQQLLLAPSLEQTSHDAISFLEAGAFTVLPRREVAVAWSIAPGMLFVTPRGSEFAREHHQASPGDRCLSVAYSAELIDTLRAAGLPQLRLSGHHATPRQRFLRHRLRALASAPADESSGLRLELIAGSLLESVVCERFNTGRVPLPVSSNVVRRIARTADLIESGYARPLKIADLALTAEMSPYHFVRSFGSLVGVPPHRYLVAVRLREAVRLILRGASVTSAAYEVGFSSPSHFTVAFRQQYGTVPSALVHGRQQAHVRALDVGPWGLRRGRMQHASLSLAKGA